MYLLWIDQNKILKKIILQVKTNSQAGHYHSPLMCRHLIITRQSLEGAQDSYLTSFILICQIIKWRVKLHLTHHASVLTGSPKLFLCVWGSSKLVSLFFGRDKVFNNFEGRNIWPKLSIYALLKIGIWRTSLEFLHIKAYGQVDFIE